MLARRTWRYFDDFLGPDDNWLPPDNFQNYPAPMLASRTSPTTIGMGFLAYQAAYDFGYLSAGEFLRRVEATFASLDKLERYRGHFYNWYDTRTLQPLRPQYVSSVDSGNLVGALITLQAALVELNTQPLLPPRSFEGLQDSLYVLLAELPAPPPPEFARELAALEKLLTAAVVRPPSPATTLTALDGIANASAALQAAIAASRPVADGGGELLYWIASLDHQVRALRDEFRLLLSEPQQHVAMPTLEALARSSDESADTAAPGMAVGPAVAGGRRAAAERLRLVARVIERCRELAPMDFEV